MLAQRLLLEGDRPIHLGTRAFAILQILVERAGETVEKRELTRLVWPNTFVEEANIRVHISVLRRALGDGQNGVRYIVNVPGRGYSFAAKVSRLVGPSEPDRIVEPVARQTPSLPNLITRLVGRSDAITKLRSELTRERMVTVVGPAGVGKTSLGLAAARCWSSDSGYEAYFADLTSVTDPATVPVAVASAISAPTMYEDVVGTMLDVLEGRRLLLILDNCEHLLDAAAGVCEVLLTGTKDVRILATSREPLRVGGEWIHRLAPLRPPPIGRDLCASEALAYPAVQLFVERATANVDTYEFSDDDAPAVADICRRLDGIPLAIEFAAARTDLCNVRTIAQRLDDRFALLTTGRRNAVPRHQTLRAAIEWSCGMLCAEKKMVLRRLSVFSAHFGPEDAVAVIGGDDLAAPLVLECLSDLVAKSIVVCDVSGHTVSYRLLETTQFYGREQLKIAGELEAVRRRHAHRFLSVCRACDAIEDGQGLLRQAMVEVRAALDWTLVRGGDIALGIDLASAATPIFLRLSLLREHRKYLELALAHVFAAADPKAATESMLRTEMALRTAVALALYYTDGPELIVDDHLQKALKIAEKISDKDHQLKVLWMLFGVAGNAGNYRRELTYAEMFATAAHASGDAMAKLRHHRIIARALGDLGQYPLAQQHLDLALQPGRNAILQSRLNAYEIDHWVAARAMRARILWLRGHPDDARQEAEQCISEALQLGHAQSTCWALAFNICPIAIWRGDLAEARRFVQLLREYSQNVFQHYHEWGMLYDQLLNEGTSQLGQHNERPFADLKPSIPAQSDLLATFDAGLVTPDTLARAQADAGSWCAAEILRAWAHRRMLGTNTAVRAASETALARSLEIARRQGATAWELRTATSLALLRRESGRNSEARAILEPARNHFTQGHDTKDVRVAADLLSQLCG